MWTSLASFYASDEWRNLRRRLLNDCGYKCQGCGEVIYKDLSNLKAHHKIELTMQNVNDYRISLNPDNIVILCAKCHNIKHGRAMHVTKAVYLVYGPPLSGKSTYVRERLNRGDLIVDMDLLFQAVSGRPLYDKPGVLLNAVYAMHDLLIDKVASRNGKWYSAWIIGGYADKYRRDQMIEKTGAVPVMMDATRQQCLDRLKASGRGEEWAGYIDEWFDLYERTTPRSF